jgi:hypothetical protein
MASTSQCYYVTTATMELIMFAMVFGMDLDPVEGKTYLHGDVNNV